MLKVLSKMAKDGTAKEEATYFVVVGGDQMCESFFGHMRNTQRRLGTAAGRSSKVESHIDPLSAVQLLRNPGIQSGFRMLRLFRQHQKGKDPDEVYKTGVLEWMYADI